MTSSAVQELIIQCSSYEVFAENINFGIIVTATPSRLAFFGAV